MGVFDRSDPAVRATYERLLIRVRRIGPVTAEQNKASIHLKGRATFADVRPLKSRLDVSIVSETPITDPRVTKHDKISPSRYHNTVPISSPHDIDAQLLDWLKRAYDLVS
jgi:hypothetical protein